MYEVTNQTREADLCDLFMNIKLDSDLVHAKRGTARPLDDVVMSDAETEQSDADSDCSAHGATGSACSQSPPLHGCAFLQVVQQQLQNYATTNGEYLEAIFTHRQMYMLSPSAHAECAHAFTELAGALEQRAWRADRDADAEAVAAFRHESWLMGGPRVR
ncbi:hypothetical protein FB107DRAFT_273650 [Schizophyllum commune]